MLSVSSAFPEMSTTSYHEGDIGKMILDSAPPTTNPIFPHKCQLFLRLAQFGSRSDQASAS